MAVSGERLVAGVELGGTKSIAVIGRGETIVDRLRVPTGEPRETLGRLSDWIGEQAAAHGATAAIGIGSFGPLSLDPRRADHGSITTTPKPGWSGVDVRGHFAERFAVPIGFDTDVAGAALAEGRWGASRGCGVHIYVTVGTGIGAGVVVGGRPVHGLVHPEVGHLRVRRVAGDGFPGACPYHGDCIEGLASGPAIAARTGADAGALPEDHPVWDAVARELSEMMALLVLTLSPERILLGGGVGQGRGFLLPVIRAHTARLLAGYVAGFGENELANILRPPRFGGDAGPLGALALARAALDGASPSPTNPDR